jgi:diguanylate cyclase (GGDEF)-like protein
MWRVRLIPGLVLLVVLVAAFTALAGVAILEVRERADAARRAQLEVRALLATANELAALDWQVHGEERISAEAYARVAEEFAHADAILASLRVLEDAQGDDDEHLVAERFGDYAVALRAELQLVRDGQIAQAEVVHEKRVIPAHETLKGELAAVQDEERLEAEAALRRADLGTIAALGSLGVVLSLVVWRSVLTARRREAERAEEFAHLAHHDALTGLPNRRRLLADLAEALAARRDRQLLLFDLDGFKAFNDHFGHLEGDALLTRLSTRLAEAVAGAGTAYRLGGDEFCVLAAPFANLVEACCAALTESRGEVPVTTSFGAVELPAEAASPTDALTLADGRLYAHKGGERTSARQQARDLVLGVLAEQQPDLHGHGHQVAELARAVGWRLGLEPRRLGDLIRAAELHDVGKVAISQDILAKPGALDAHEWEVMRRHTLIGERILLAAPALASVAPIVRASHERWDGTGYPDALARETIPLESRIVAVCDAFDAMTEQRPYNVPRSPAEAVAELERCAGSQFDPAVVAAFRAEVAERWACPGGPEVARAVAGDNAHLFEPDRQCADEVVRCRRRAPDCDVEIADATRPLVHHEILNPDLLE